MCKRFNIEDVAILHGITPIKRPSGGEVYAVCPNCGNNKGKFSYVIQKGQKHDVAQCWACGFKVKSAVDLHMQLTGEQDFNRAVVDIFQAINGNIEFKTEHERRFKERENDSQEIERASDEKCSKVYYALLRELSLKIEHKQDLLRRGLTEDDIKRFKFASTPNDKIGICNKLISSGYNLEGVPGFFINKKGAWELNIPGKGYFCPVFDGEYNYILGFQIRVDKPYNGAKYLWVSSAGKKNGLSSGGLSSYLPGKNENVVIITEGILKSIVIYSLLKGQVSVIGVPGVKCINSLKPYLQRFEENAFCFLAYDMDKKIIKSELKLYQEALAMNVDFNAVEVDEKYKNIKKAIKIAEDEETLSSLVTEFKIPSHKLTWDITDTNNEDDFTKYLWNGNLKGLDDFLLDYSKKDKFLNYLFATSKKQLKLLNFLNL